MLLPKTGKCTSVAIDLLPPERPFLLPVSSCSDYTSLSIGCTLFLVTGAAVRTVCTIAIFIVRAPMPNSTYRTAFPALH